MKLVEFFLKFISTEQLVVAYIIILLFCLRQISFTFYVGFLFGVINTVIGVVFVFQYIVLRKLREKNKNCNSLFEYVDIKIQEIIKDDEFNQIESRNIKKKYYINKYSDENKVNEMQQRILVDESINSQTINHSINQTPNRNHKSSANSRIINHSLVNNTVINNNSQTIFTEISKLQNKKQMHTYSNYQQYFVEIQKIQNECGQQFSAFGQSKILSYEQESIIYKDDSNQHLMNIEILQQKDKSLLDQLLFQQKKCLQLPFFQIFRLSIQKIGRNYQLLSEFTNSNVEMIQNYIEQYKQSYLNVRKQKQDMKQEYCQKKNKYLKEYKQYLDQEKQSIKRMNEYNEAKKKRADPKTIIKMELDLRLNMQILGSLKTKYIDSQDQFQDFLKKVVQFNETIKQFQDQNRVKFNKVVQITIRSVLQGYSNFNQDIKDILVHIVNLNYSQMKQQFEQQSKLMFNFNENSIIGQENFRISSQQQNMNSSQQSLLQSEQQLDSFCIQEDDFNVINISAIQLIKMNMETYKCLEKQLMTRVEHVYYILKYNNQIIVQFSNFIKTYSNNLGKIKNINKNYSNIISSKKFNHFVNQIDKFGSLTENMVNSVQELIDGFQNFTKDNEHMIKTQHQKQNKENFMPYVCYLNQNLKKMVVEKESCNSTCNGEQNRNEDNEFNISLIRQKNKFTSQYLDFNQQLHKFQEQNNLKIQNFKQELFFIFVRWQDTQDKFIDEYTEIIEQELMALEKQEEQDSIQLDDQNSGSQVIEKTCQKSVKDFQSNLKEAQNSLDKCYQEEDYQVQENTTDLLLTNEWKNNAIFKKKVIKILNVSLNSKRNPKLQQINVSDFRIDEDFEIDFSDVSPQMSSHDEFLYDLQLRCKGNMYFQIDTFINLEWPYKTAVPIIVHILLKSVYGKLRICYTNMKNGKSWYSFMNDPVVNFQINPLVGQSQYNIGNIPQVFDSCYLKIQNLINEMIQQKLKKMTFPNRRTLAVPMSKLSKEKRKKLKEQEMQIIQEVDDISTIRKGNNSLDWNNTTRNRFM